MYNQEEIVKALKTIQCVCEQQKECETCPFSKNETCILQMEAPIDWDIADKEIVWKAFK